MKSAQVIVYAGEGSSHSWTWLADLFEGSGNFEVRFLESQEFPLHLVEGTDIAIVSGGDGFRIAGALKGKGFAHLREFISKGGTYVGICAGAYLPLPSSLDPFSEFILSDTKIENVDPRDQDLSGVPSRVAISYGSCSIVHPVRGEVVLDVQGREMLAPIYGGPVFKEPATDRVLARYKGFTQGTEFQMSRRLGERMIPGKPAVISASFGNGRLLLFGPHFEHPKYPHANDSFLKMLGVEHIGVLSQGGVDDNPSLDRAIADLKVAIVGLENRTFVVGKKLWDGSRYLELVRAIEKRTWTLGFDLAEEIATSLWRVKEDLVKTRIGIESDADSTTELLVESARTCVDHHFQALARGR